MMEAVNIILLAAQLAFGTGTSATTASTTTDTGVVITVDTVGLQ